MVLTSTVHIAFCLILLVWVWFFVPETKGVPIEEMDELFGGNSGQQDLRRIADIRNRLGITSLNTQSVDYDQKDPSRINDLVPKRKANMDEEWVEKSQDEAL